MFRTWFAQPVKMDAGIHIISLLTGLAALLTLAGCTNGGAGGQPAGPTPSEGYYLPASSITTPVPFPTRSPSAKAPDPSLPAAPTRVLPVSTGTTVVVTRPSQTPPLPTVTPTPAKTSTLTPATIIQPACNETSGRIETGSLDTSLLRLPLQYRVYLPPCYKQDKDRRYPVLYLFHGQSSTDDQWDRIGADETATRLFLDGRISPLIMVMPYDRYGGQPIETGFSQAVMEVLLPFIDKTYRTQADRQHRAAGGMSRGGGWAIHFGISQAASFGVLGAHSPAVFHSDAQRMRTWLDDLSQEEAPRIFIDIGERDRPEILRSTEWFVGLLNAYDLAHDWRFFAGYHSEEYWSSHMEQYLIWYTQDW